MSLYRVILVALATAFTIGMTSLASASCCGAPVGCCGTPAVYAAPAPVMVAPAPVAVAPQPVVVPAPIGVTAAATPFGGPCCSANGCGDCVNWVPAGAGCGGCGGYGGYGGYGGGCGVTCGGFGGGWSWGRCGGCCGGCGGCCGVGAAMPSPLYVVNQGPVYSGPGLTIPYQTYSPDTAYAPAANYPYVPGFGSPPAAGYPYNPGYSAAPAPIYPPLYHHLYARPHYAYPRYAYRHYVPMRRVYAPHVAPHWRHYP